MATDRTFVKGLLMEMWQRTKQYPDSAIPWGAGVRGAGILGTTWAHPKQTGTQDQAGRRERMQHRPGCSVSQVTEAKDPSRQVLWKISYYTQRKWKYIPQYAAKWFPLSLYLHCLSTKCSTISCDPLISKYKEHVSVFPTYFLTTFDSNLIKTVIN